MDRDDELRKILNDKFRRYMREIDIKRKYRSKYWGKVVELTAEEFYDLVDGDVPFFVDFWAEWCAPCKAMAPIVEGLAKQYANKMIFGKLNVDLYPDIARVYNIMGIPTFIIFYRGREINRLVGTVPRPRLEQEIKRVIELIK